MKITISDFGTTADGLQTRLFTISNENGFTAQFTDYGAIWVSAIIPTAASSIDVLLGYDNVSGYESDGCHFGAIVGRNANRITGPSYHLNGQEYPLTGNEIANNQPVNLHSGPSFYGKRLWQAVCNEAAGTITFVLQSPHMDQGYPGNLTMSVTYQLTENNTIKVIYDALCDADTIFNPTNHAYFNLNGQGKIWNHSLWVNANRYTEAIGCVPTGRVLPVEGTKFDFTCAKAVEVDLDDNFCLAKDHTLQDVCARYIGDCSGITMEVHTDLPGMQIYTGNFLDVACGKQGASYTPGDAACFESQFYPNAINIDHPEYEKPILPANTPFHSETWYCFLTK